MNDAKIRRAVHKRILRHVHRNPEARVVDELGLYNGQHRIDIAVLNDRLHGYEIKSELDDLSRLPAQAAAYSQIFSKLTLVVAERLLENSLETLPKWWGIIIASQGPRGGIHLRRFRRASLHGNLRAESVARLLWRQEALELAQTHGAKIPTSKTPRMQLYQELSHLLSAEELQRIVSNRLKERQGWRDHPPP